MTNEEKWREEFVKWNKGGEVTPTFNYGWYSYLEARRKAQEEIDSLFKESKKYMFLHSEECIAGKEMRAKMDGEIKKLQQENEELKKKTGFTTSLAGKTCNNCDNLPRDD